MRARSGREARAQPGEPRPPRRIARPADRGGDPPEEPLGGLGRGQRDDTRVERAKAGGVQRHRAGEEPIESALALDPPPAAGAQLGNNCLPHGATGSLVSEAQAGPLKGRVPIARIAEEGLALLREEREEARPRHRQERPDQPAPRQFAHRRHSRQPVDSAAGAAANEVGLDLILAMVRGEQVQAAMRAAPLCHQPVARIAGGFLNTARRLVAGPHQDFVRDGAGGEPAGQRPGLRGAFGPQPVVDGQRAGAAAAPTRPFVGQHDKRQAVGPAGDRDRDQGPRLEAADRVKRGGKLRHCQWS